MIININYENHKNKFNIDNYESILSIKSRFFDHDNEKIKNTLFFNDDKLLKDDDYIDNGEVNNNFKIYNKKKGGSSMVYTILYWILVVIIVISPIFIIISGIIPAVSTLLGLIIEKTFKQIANYLKCNYGKKTLVGRISWVFSGVLPYILMAMAIYIVITFPLMILCTSVKGQKIMNDPKSLCSPINAASMTGFILIIFYYLFYIMFRSMDWFLGFLINITKLNYSIYTTIAPWIESLINTWDTTKYTPVYAIPFLGQGLLGYFQFLDVALISIEMVVTQIKDLGCAKILNANFFAKQLEDKVKNKLPNSVNENIKSYTDIAKDSAKVITKNIPKAAKETLKDLKEKAKDRKIKLDQSKKNDMESRLKNINKYRNYIQEKSNIENDDQICGQYANPCCSKNNILNIADAVNQIFHTPQVQTLSKNYRVYNGIILTIQAFYEEAMRLNEFNEQLKEGHVPNKKIYFKRVLKTQNDLISDKTKRLLEKYLYHTDTFDKGVNNEKLMEIINEDISKHNFNNAEKIKEIKYKIAQLDFEGRDYSKSIGAAYDIGGTLVKIILKRVCIEIACNIFNTSNSTIDIIQSMGEISNITDLFKASSATGVFIVIFYIICVIVLIILGLPFINVY